MVLRLYLLTNDAFTGYDTYDSAVVAAKPSQAARSIHPSGNRDTWDLEARWDGGLSWPTDRTKIGVEYVGVAGTKVKPGVICASFNAG